MDEQRYEFIDAPDDAGSVKVFDRMLDQRVLNLPHVIAHITAILYMNIAQAKGWEHANHWMNGYCAGAVDTELIINGYGK